METNGTPKSYIAKGRDADYAFSQSDKFKAAGDYEAIKAARAALINQDEWQNVWLYSVKGKRQTLIATIY